MFDPERFLSAQQDCYVSALGELREGRKQSHWMWFVFPQLGALGHSSTAKHFGLDDSAAAKDYLSHPVLGPRLIEAARALLAHRNTPISTIMGPIDGKKLLSTATLFAAVGGDPVFRQLLNAFYGGRQCRRTLDLIGLEAGAP